MTYTEATCPYGFDVVDELVGRNITEHDVKAWPCDVRIRWMELQPLRRLVRWLLSYGTCIVIVSGLVLNTLSFVVLTRKNMRKKTANTYLTILAVYDSSTLLFNFAIGVLRSVNNSVNSFFQANPWLCIAHAVAIEWFVLLSTWTIVTFTVERFLMVKFPMKARTWSPKRTFIAPAIVSIIMTAVAFHKIGFVGFENDSVFGYKGCQTNRKMNGILIYIHVALKSWIPTSIIVALNIFIIIELLRNQRKRRQMVHAPLTRTDEKTTLLLLIVSTSYVLFVLPVGILQTAEVFWHWTKMVPPGNPTYSEFMITKINLKWSRSFFFFFYQFNFAINFFLYVASSKYTRFRHHLKSVIGLPTDTISAQETRHATNRNGASLAATGRNRVEQPNVDANATLNGAPINVLDAAALNGVPMTVIGAGSSNGASMNVLDAATVNAVPTYALDAATLNGAAINVITDTTGGLVLADNTVLTLDRRDDLIYL